MSESQWRTRSRQIISEVMASVPADATLPQVRKLLREAYPFGTRQYHPYKMWCSEQRIALNTWRDARKLEESHTDGDRCGVRITFLKSGQPWIDVLCSWCKGRVAGGCMVCVRHHQTMIEALGHPERKALVMAQRAGDKVAGKLLADWYRDNVQGLIEE